MLKQRFATDYGKHLRACTMGRCELYVNRKFCNKHPRGLKPSPHEATMAGSCSNAKRRRGNALHRVVVRGRRDADPIVARGKNPDTRQILSSVGGEAARRADPTDGWQGSVPGGSCRRGGARDRSFSAGLQSPSSASRATSRWASTSSTSAEEHLSTSSSSLSTSP